jgi:hypothetical protein
MEDKKMKKILLAALAVTALTVTMFAVLGCEKDPDPSPSYPIYTVLFRMNNSDEGSTPPDPVQTKTTKSKNTVDLPTTNPTRPGFKFLDWNLKADGTGEEFTESTKITADMVTDKMLPVFARWKLDGDGGTPYVRVSDGALVHRNPKLAASTTGHGSFSGTFNENGSVTLGGGAFQYKFPTTGTDSNGIDYNIADYSYFMIEYTLSGEATGAGTGCLIKQYNSSTNYGGIKNVYPWWSNSDNRTQEFPISGAGTSGGIAFQFNGTAETPYTILISSIIFYKVDSHTVTFDLDGGTGAAGSNYNPISVREGTSLGDAMPADPTKENFFFAGWFDGANLVTAVTPIMKDTALKAKWTDTEPEKVEFISVPGGGSGVPIYRFTMPATKTWADIKAITFTAMVLDETSYNMTGQGRVHVVGNYEATGMTPTFSTTGGLAVSSWGGNRIVIHENNQNIAAILNNANNTSDTNLRGKWVTFTIDISHKSDADVTGTNINPAWAGPEEFTEKNPAQTPADTDIGPFLLGVGITGNTTALPAYYQKDVALILDDDSEVGPNGFDEYLTGDSGVKLGKLFFTSTGDKPVNRSIVYAPDEL